MTKRPTKRGATRSSAKAKRSPGPRATKRKSPSKKEVATFAALLKKGHNKRN